MLSCSVRGQARQLLTRALARVRRDDMNVDELGQPAKPRAHAIDELALARERAGVVAADGLDVQPTKAGDVDPDSAFHHGVPGFRFVLPLRRTPLDTSVSCSHY